MGVISPAHVNFCSCCVFDSDFFFVVSARFEFHLFIDSDLW